MRRRGLEWVPNGRPSTAPGTAASPEPADIAWKSRGSRVGPQAAICASSNASRGAIGIPTIWRAEMRRRGFLAALGGAIAATWLDAARGQSVDRLRRIGALLTFPGTEENAKIRLEGFRDGLQHLGWADGHNVRIDVRWASSQVEQHRSLARELVGLKPDVLTSSSTPLTAALMDETSSIPIVFSGVVEPI